jgi:hypothetical protein
MIRALMLHYEHGGGRKLEIFHIYVYAFRCITFQAVVAHGSWLSWHTTCQQAVGAWFESHEWQL